MRLLIIISASVLVALAFGKGCFANSVGRSEENVKPTDENAETASVDSEQNGGKPRDGRTFWGGSRPSTTYYNYRRPSYYSYYNYRRPSYYSYYPYRRYNHFHDSFGRPHYLTKRNVAEDSSKDIENLDTSFQVPEEEGRENIKNLGRDLGQFEEEDNETRQGRTFWNWASPSTTYYTYRRPSSYSYYPYRRYNHFHDSFGRAHYLAKRSVAGDNEEDIENLETAFQSPEEKSIIWPSALPTKRSVPGDNEEDIENLEASFQSPEEKISENIEDLERDLEDFEQEGKETRQGRTFGTWARPNAAYYNYRRPSYYRYTTRPSTTYGNYRRPSYYPYRRNEHFHDSFGRAHYLWKRSAAEEDDQKTTVIP